MTTVHLATTTSDATARLPLACRPSRKVSHNAPLTPANRATRHHWPSRCDPDERCAERANTDYRLDNLLFPASVVADTPIAVVESQFACGTGVRDPCRVADVFQMLIPNLGL